MASVGEVSIGITADTSRLNAALSGAQARLRAFQAFGAQVAQIKAIEPLKIDESATQAFARVAKDLSAIRFEGTRALAAPFFAFTQFQEQLAAAGKLAAEPLKLGGISDTDAGNLVKRLRELSTTVTGHLKSIKEALENFGVDLKNTAFLEVFTAMTSSLEGAKKAGEALKGVGAKQGLDQLVAAFNAVSQAWKAFKDSTDFASPLARALGGARVGATIGGELGGTWGALIGGLAGGIFGIFRSPGWAKAAKEAAKVFGTEISKELAKQIEEASKKHNIGRREASLLFISQAMEGAKGKDPRSFSGSVIELLNAIATKSVPAKEGLAALSSAFDKIKEAALSAGSVGDRALVGIVKRAMELGLDKFESIKTFVSGQLTSAQGGAAAAIQGIQIISPETALAQAGLAASIFWAKFKTDGMLAAADAFKGIFASLQEKLGGFGQNEAVLGILGPIQQMLGLADNPAVRGALEGVQGVKAMVEGLANASFLMQSDLTNAGVLIKQAFDQAVAGGLSTEQAYRAIAPALTSLISASENYGFTIDATTQKLIAEAQAHGIAFPLDPVDRLRESIDVLIETLGGVPPQLARIRDSARELGGTKVYIDFEYRNTGGGAGGPGEGAGGGGGGEGPRHGEPDFSAQGGFFHPRLPRTSRPEGATLIAAHPGEEVSIGPPGSAAMLGAALGGEASRVTHVHNLILDGQILARFVEDGARTGRIRIHEGALVRHS